MHREISECIEISQRVESSALGFEHFPGTWKNIYLTLCNDLDSEAQENTQDSALAKCLYFRQLMILLSHALWIQTQPKAGN